MPAQSPDFPEFDGQTAAVWDSIAEWWDDRIGDGNATQDLLVEPSQERLLDLRPGQRVLDIGCGAGRFTRRMATNDVSIVAIDQSEVFLSLARRRTAELPGDVADRIDYRLINATDNEAMLALGEGRFDAAVATMSIMDMASITPMISALTKLLRPGGRFIWSVTHPAFNSGTARLFAEEEYRDGGFVQHYGVRVTDYLNAVEIEGVGIPGQPHPQHYFHRPISMLFNACFEAGFVLDGLEEPAIPPGNENSGTSPLSWARIHDVSQVLVARMRLPSPARTRALKSRYIPDDDGSGVTPEFPEFNDRTATDWNNVAEWWDNAIGNGNAMTDVLEPAQERLLGLDPGDHLLEIGCGAGRFARHMAAVGATVTAFDHSEVFINRARERTTQFADQISYEVLNATDATALLGLGEKRFDAAVSAMALMNMASIEPLISTLPALLKPGGRFVWSVSHPAFNSGTAKSFFEEEHVDGGLVERRGVTVSEYLEPFYMEEIGIRGQPSTKKLFHRPMSMLLNTCFRYGFVVDRIEEPITPGEVTESTHPLSWRRFDEIPPALIVRMRLVG